MRLFILDVYRFCESRREFDRKELAEFIFSHREAERLARHAQLTPVQFASVMSREFIPRLCSLGYLDMSAGKAWVRNKDARPMGFQIHTLEARTSDYIRLMMNVGKMSDEELFNGCV